MAMMKQAKIGFLMRWVKSDNSKRQEKRGNRATKKRKPPPPPLKGKQSQKEYFVYLNKAVPA
ncbi:hypothetical protein CCACVL1_28731 [Corchorus capsularis]|uniref:Uncharacterized protein n=1 Tax=Corchorus capsularis TaxID=210143 RepID=A0A1R3G5I6_COCAP|nr:hypothetical protein CCACVL1_28731 [Corchorus capsularis]